jgi:hypothetical protein
VEISKSPSMEVLNFFVLNVSLTLVRKLKFSNYKFVDAETLETDVITYRHNAFINFDNLSGV